MKTYNLIDESGCIIVERMELSPDEVLMVESSGITVREVK